MGSSAGFGYVLWATAQTKYQMEEVQDNFLKACLILLRDCDDKKYVHKQ
jgi:hypothetical protein